MTPSARTTQRLRRQGYLVDIVERWLEIPARAGQPAKKFRKDCFGAADLLAAHPLDRRILLVQATTAAHVSHRLEKVRTLPSLRAWLQAGGRFEIWGWSQDEAGNWQVRIVELNENMLATLIQAPRRRLPQRREQGELW